MNWINKPWTFRRWVVIVSAVGLLFVGAAIGVTGQPDPEPPSDEAVEAAAQDRVDEAEAAQADAEEEAADAQRGAEAAVEARDAAEEAQKQAEDDAAAAEARPPEIKTETVEVEVTPPACVEALDLAQETFGLVYDMTDAMIRYLDAPFGSAAETQALDDMAAVNTALEPLVDPFTAANGACRSAS